MSVRIISLFAASLFVLNGCDGDHDHPHDEAKPAGQSASTTLPSTAHDHEHDHDREADHHHGDFKPVPIGSVSVGGFAFAVTQTSPLAAGEELNLALQQTSGTGEPKAIRLWVGSESARGSVKSRTHKHGEDIDAHVEVPDPIPNDAKLWLQVETDQGMVAASLELTKP